MSGDVGGLTFDELHAIVRANRGDDLRAAAEGWARAADRLDRQADTLTAGLPTLERAWGSEAGRAHGDAVRVLVHRMRVTADVARYNHAQLLAAADATDEAIRQLDLVWESAERDGAVRDAAARDAAARYVADALNETYANVAARLTKPLLDVGQLNSPSLDIGQLNSPSVARRSGPLALVSSVGVPAVGEASLAAMPVGEASLAAMPVGEASLAAMPVGEASPDDDAWGIDIDADLPDAVGWVPLPASRTHGAPGGGRGECFPATPRPAVALVLPAVDPAVRAGSPVPPASAAGPRTASSGPPAPSSGPPAVTPGAAPAAPRPTVASRRAAEETYTDTRGHHVQIRWRGDGSAEPHP